MLASEAAERLFWAEHTWDIPGDPNARRVYFAKMADLAQTVAQHSVDGPRSIGTVTISNERAWWLMTAAKFRKYATGAGR